jgi:hypothetical protein
MFSILDVQLVVAVRFSSLYYFWNLVGLLTLSARVEPRAGIDARYVLYEGEED